MTTPSRSDELVYAHSCAPPLRTSAMGNPGTRRWFCPECGTLWIFAMRIVGRKPVGAWRPASRSADAEIARLRTLLSEITTLADRLETHYRHTPEDLGAVLAAGLIRRTLEDT